MAQGEKIIGIDLGSISAPPTQWLLSWTAMSQL